MRENNNNIKQMVTPQETIATVALRTIRELSDGLGIVVVKIAVGLMELEVE